MFEKKQNKLKKELNLFDVFAIATGTTIATGYFVLPGLAAQQSGIGMVLSYILAGFTMIPATLSIVELATGMPRAGGVYYFLDRTLGPMIGTVGGIGTWLALIFKIAFALIGMGAYISIFFPQVPLLSVALVFAILLGVLNIAGSKQGTILQIILVIGILALLSLFTSAGLTKIELYNFTRIFDSELSSILSTAGFVYLSYAGITKAASLSEEVKNPEKNIPYGILISLMVSIVFYALGTVIMVGVLPIKDLAGSLIPAALAAEKIFGSYGLILLTAAALFSFISVANAGIMSASRFPLAMSRDHILPGTFKKLTSKGTPINSILVTTGLVVIILIFLDPTNIAKLASVFQLIIFSLISVAVIIIRESKIQSYDPGFKSPFYPWTQIFGSLFPLILIYEMGLMSLLFSLVLIVIGIIWYWFYGKNRVVRSGAIYHLFERLGRFRYDGLDLELRSILKEKGLRESDPFDEIVTRSHVLDLSDKISFEEVVKETSRWISRFVAKSSAEIEKLFLDGTRMGATPVTHGIALPHIRLDGLEQAEMVIVRGQNGVHIKFKNPLKDFIDDEQDVQAVFFLVSPQKDPTQHLRILAQIAGRVEEDTFDDEWKSAKDEQELKEALVHEDRLLSIIVKKDSPSEALINNFLKDVNFPEGCLVAMLRREGKTIVPTGNTVINEGDRLTIIGDPKGMVELKKMYAEVN